VWGGGGYLQPLPPLPPLAPCPAYARPPFSAPCDPWATPPPHRNALPIHVSSRGLAIPQGISCVGGVGGTLEERLTLALLTRVAVRMVERSLARSLARSLCPRYLRWICRAAASRGSLGPMSLGRGRENRMPPIGDSGWGTSSQSGLTPRGFRVEGSKKP